jgi:dipeptidyl aminopeptidase/acylaminoacyl peptidase
MTKVVYAPCPHSNKTLRPILRIGLLFSSLTLGLAAMHATAALAEPRVLTSDDYYQFLNVTEPQASPDGTAVAYVVSSNDRVADAAKTTVWLANWDGSEHRPLTQTENATHPRFSPDGRYLSFLSARPAESAAQVWLLDLRGGEARQVTHTTGEISSYSWSPDRKQLVLVMRKTEARDAKAPKPIVIDSYHFKADEIGYLNTGTHKHLYLVDVATGTEAALTATADYDESDPAWSPDGKLLAYVSNHDKDAERSGIDELYLIEPRAGAVPHKLMATYSPNKQRIAFSPDGQFICFLQGREPKYNAYMADRLAMVSVATGSVSPLSDRLDQQVSSPAFSADGTSIDFIVEDHGAAYEARLTFATGAIARISPEGVTVLAQSSAAGRTVILGSSDTQPPEVFALDAGGMKPLTTHNAALLADLRLGAVEDIHFKSKDGTEIQGQIIKPPSYVAGRRYPAILWIHGGPNGQDQHELISKGYSPSLERQLFAARGYVVLAVNYRGSTGRGQKFQQSILADWGHKEVEEDLLAAVDYAVAVGIADPAKLGIGGWSYGGMLTDYTIASDTRFKAAISGAGSGDQVGMYGLDQYALQYNCRIGPSVEEFRAIREIILSVLPCRPDSHAHAVHGRRQGLQCADRGQRTDVPRPAYPRRAQRARGLSW